MKFKPLAIAALIAWLAVAATAQRQDIAGQPEGAGRTWAVIVGISKYQKLPGGQQLQFADHDAIAFADAIKKIGVPPERIRLLVGAEATASAIKGALGNWLARQVAEADTVLFFFSGHGYYEQEFGESYLLGCDADVKDPFSTALSISEIQQAITRRIRARHVLVMTDALRRDFFDPDAGGAAAATAFINSLNQLATRAGLSVIAASGPGEFSREGQRWNGQGVFTRHLLDALSSEAVRNSDGTVTADRVFDQVAARVASDTSNKQRPWRSSTALAQIAISSGGSKSGEPVRASTTASLANPVAAAPAELQPEKTTVTHATIAAPPVAVVTRSVPVETQTAIGQRKPNEKPLAASPVSSASVSTPTTKPAATAALPAEKVVKQPEVKSAPKASAQVAASTQQTALPSLTTATTPQKAVPVSDPVIARNEPPVPGASPSASWPVVSATASTTAPNSSSSPNTATPVAAPTARTSNPSAASSNIGATSKPATIKPRAATPPAIANSETSATANHPPTAPLPRAGEISSLPTPPRPAIVLPSVASVGAEPARTQPVSAAPAISINKPDAAPPPLILELEAAIARKNLLEPKGASAWDLYQKLATDSATAGEAARLKLALADALALAGREIVAGDVRADTITDKADDFRRAGQMLARARSLKPENTEISALEKLCAAQALIALQFYDEAERALAPLQNARLAAVDNAMGLVYQGKLDGWRAERAFKRAAEVEPNWAAPHYNLAMLYRSQQNEAALAEFERAAALGEKNADILLALGDEYFARQQWPRAADVYRKAVALKPADDNLHTKLGHALYSFGQQEEANREYQKARDLRNKRP
jgi:tetratricopeptide (TPR) repeat protein